MTTDIEAVFQKRIATSVHEMVAYITQLRAVGFNVPDGVIDAGVAAWAHEILRERE